MKQRLLTLTASLILTLSAQADHATGHTKSLVLKNKEGAALLGYDPVAYFTDGRPVSRGLAEVDRGMAERPSV